MIYTFATLEHFNAAFCERWLKGFPTEITLKDQNATFKFFTESQTTSLQAKEGHAVHVALYRAVVEDKITDLVLGWTIKPGLILTPVGAKLIPNPSVIEEKGFTVADNAKEQVIGVTVDVVINGLNAGEPIRAKTDTGASSCSLDAQNVQVTKSQYDDGEIVVFEFRDKRYKTRVKGYQSVKSADGGTQNRPTASFTVECNGKVYDQVEFNLNDRTGMEYDVLLGMNFLSKDTFLIDPQQESVKFVTTQLEQYESLFKAEAILATHNFSTELKEVVDVLTKYPDISFSHIIQKVKADLSHTE